MTCFKHPDCELPKAHEGDCASLTGRVLKYAPDGQRFVGTPPITVQRRPRTTIGKLWATYRDIRAARKRRVPFHF